MQTSFDKVAADRLAYEVAWLVQNGHLNSRSRAGDALLDYLRVGQVGGPRDVPSWMNQYKGQRDED